MATTLLSEVKTSLRITHDSLDSDIQRNIDSALDDLKRLGVDVNIHGDETEHSPLLIKAIELYVKWQYDYAEKGEQYRVNYERLRDVLSMSEDYKDV